MHRTLTPPRVIVTALFVLAATFLAAVSWRASDHSTDSAASDPSAPLAAVIDTTPPPAPEATVLRHKIRMGESIGTILPSYGLPVDVLRAAALEHHDLANIRAGKTLQFRTEPGEDGVSSVSYALDDDRTLVLERQHDDTWLARVDEIIYERRLGTREFSVETSLWQAAIDQGLRAADIAALARVYQFDLDFNTEVRAGATARMVIVEMWTEGAFAKLGPPLAVRFTNLGRDYVAIRYEKPDGAVAYYDQDGTSRKKAFLRSPLEFSRVTSGFSLKRFHPVLKKSRPHYGTDFGAPTGTPIRAIGEGRVVHSGNNGGHGRFVKLDHEGPYQSSYSHLSRIAVKNGENVRQGQIIGYVGSTGLATGPHLHFQFWVNGQIVNPMTVELPRATKLAQAELAEFKETRDRLLSMLDGIADDDSSGDTDSPGR